MVNGRKTIKICLFFVTKCRELTFLIGSFGEKKILLRVFR